LGAVVILSCLLHDAFNLFVLICILP
jgi:hypothetical protein